MLKSRRSFLATAAAGVVLPALMTPALTGRAMAATTAKKPNAATYVIPQEHQPVEVRLSENFAPGQLLVDPNTFFLYWTLADRYALRFVVGVGKGNLYESGVFWVGAKKEWPSWTPTKDMIDRNPAQYAKWKDGMPGGPGNPLGARALYLFDQKRGDTFLRIHGTTDPWTIGSAVSNGCVRLANDHIGLLYDLVPMMAPVVLYERGVA